MFENSKWINYVIEKEPDIKKYEPSPYIAKTFSVEEKPVKATLNICGYGEGAYFLNGRVIPDSSDRLTPQRRHSPLFTMFMI